MHSVITITTDFGLSGTYVAAMKGVILDINPEANIVDISHTIEPQNLLQASFAIDTVYEVFPQRTIHVVVVDPGVGTNRRAIILRTPKADFVAPDNGVLSHVLHRCGASTNSHSGQSLEVKIPQDVAAVNITESKYWRSPVSPTFHGRDIFAPVAARLSLGLEPLEFGVKIDTAVVLPLPHPHVTNGEITGHILHIDRFGNMITDITQKDLGNQREPVIITVGTKLIRGLVSTYGESQDIMALIGSTGHLEIAMRNGNAAAVLNARAGDSVIVKRAS